MIDNPKQPRTTRKRKGRGPSATTPNKQTKLMKIKNINAIVAYKETKTMVAKHPHEGDNIDIHKHGKASVGVEPQTTTITAKHPP